MAGPDRLGKMLVATITNPAVDPIVMPDLPILNTRRAADELDEDFAALRLERVAVVAELRDAVAAVIAARFRHAEEDEARPAAIRDALRTGVDGLWDQVAALTGILTAERELEVAPLWDQVAAVAERLIGCAAVSSGWLAEFSRLEGERQQALWEGAEDERRRETRRREVDGSSFVELAPESLEVVGKGEPVAEEVRVDASRERLRLVGEPFVAVDAARLRSWIGGQREVAPGGEEAA